MKKNKTISEEERKALKALYLKAGGTGLSLLNPEKDNFTPALKKPTTISPAESSAENGPGEDTEPTESGRAADTERTESTQKADQEPTELERISIRLRPEDIERLREYFESRDITLGQGIRSAIKDFMERRGI